MKVTLQKKKLLFVENTKQIRLKKNDLAEYGKKRQPMEGKKVNNHKQATAKNRTLGLSPKFRSYFGKTRLRKNEHRGLVWNSNTFLSSSKETKNKKTYISERKPPIINSNIFI